MKNNRTFKYIWNLKDKGKSLTIKWSITKTGSTCTCGTRSSDLCLTEKLFIAKADPVKLLKERSKTISECRRCMKYTLRCLR